MPWYDGPTLLEHLETIEIAGDRNLDHRRFPVQWVIRPMSDEHHDYRGYAGQVAGGVWRAGDEVVVLPSGRRSRVEAVETADGPLEAAVPGHVRDDPARGRRRRRPRRPARRPGRAADGRARARGARLLDERAAARAARAARASSTRPARCARSSTSSSRSSTCTRSTRSVAPERLELNDIGRVSLRLSRAALRRPVRRQPRHRRVRPHRRGDERDRRRRHGARGPRLSLELSLAGLLIGLLVGMTGMGGGSLMTPMLVLRLRLQADGRDRHGHPPRRDLQELRRRAAPAARHTCTRG